MTNNCFNNNLISCTNPSITNLAAGRQYLLFDANPQVVQINVRNTSIVADGVHNFFNVGTPLPNDLGYKVYVIRVLMDVSTIFSGNSVATAQVTDGTNILMPISDNNIEATGSYITLLPMTFTSTGDQLVIQFFESDGSTPAIPTSGAASIIVEYEEF